MTYIDWILEQVEKKNKIGDLARDMDFDIRQGAQISCRQDLVLRLKDIGACRGAMDAEEDAHDAYKCLMKYRKLTKEYL